MLTHMHSIPERCTMCQWCLSENPVLSKEAVSSQSGLINGFPGDCSPTRQSLNVHTHCYLSHTPLDCHVSINGLQWRGVSGQCSHISDHRACHVYVMSLSSPLMNLKQNVHVKASYNNKHHGVMVYEINAWYITQGIFQLNVTQINWRCICMYEYKVKKILQRFSASAAWFLRAFHMYQQYADI